MGRPEVTKTKTKYITIEQVDLDQVDSHLVIQSAAGRTFDRDELKRRGECLAYKGRVYKAFFNKIDMKVGDRFRVSIIDKI
jgi:hypothetical protein